MDRLYALLLLAATTLDQGIKQYVEDSFKTGEKREGDHFIVRKVYNRGFALNTMDQKQTVVKGVSVAALAAVAAADVTLFSKKRHLLSKLGMTFITAGAISNIYDRLIRGKVIDFISLKSKHKKIERLTANLADIYLAIGMLITALGDAFGL